MNTQGWFPLEWTGWISLQSKRLSRVFSNTTVQKHQFSRGSSQARDRTRVSHIAKDALPSEPPGKPHDQPRQHIKKQRHYFAEKVHLVKAMVFLVVMCRCESWTIKKAEHQRIDTFEPWCLKRLLRVPWTVRRSNQSILKKISPEYSLERLDAETLIL